MANKKEQEDARVAQLLEWQRLRREAEKAAQVFKGRYNVWALNVKAGLADQARIAADDAIQAHWELQPLLERLREYEAEGFPATQLDIPDMDEVVEPEPALDWGTPSVKSSGLDDPSYKGGRRRA